MTSLEEAYSAERFRRLGHRVVDMLADCLGRTLDGKVDQVLPWKDPETAYAEIQQLAGEDHELFHEVWQRCIRLHHPKYMGHQITPPLPIAALAGMLADLMNNGMAVYEMGIAGTAMERFVVRTVADQLRMNQSADGVMTSGGSLANLTALLAARSVKCQDVWSRGGTSSLAVMVSDAAHYCIDRAVRIMGWGAEGVIRIPTDECFRVRTDLLPEYLRRARDHGREVIGVVGSAGCTATGSFDDLRQIGSFCKEHGLWFHVDGAHGAAVAFSEKYRHLLDGIDSADSVVLDFHKLLMTPALASAVVFRQGDLSYRAFSQNAQYLWSQAESADWFNSAKRTFECTKTMMSLRVFSIIASHGIEIFDQNVTRLHELAADFADRIQASHDFELALRPQTNIVCFRFRAGVSDSRKIDQLNERIRERLITDGEFYIVQTILGDAVWLRTTLANPFTSHQEIDGLLTKIRAIAASVDQPTDEP